MYIIQLFEVVGITLNSVSKIIIQLNYSSYIKVNLQNACTLNPTLLASEINYQLKTSCEIKNPTNSLK